MKKFDVPDFYRSNLIGAIKNQRKELDPKKKDFSPTIVDFGPVQIHLARHFGFCYGVENAIDIAYKALHEHPDKNIYLLSEMIHNPTVNEDLLKKGMKFLQHTDGSERIPIDSLSSEDIVIVPAFGTTVEIEEQLKGKGIDPYAFNTTCPFVEKVWKRGAQLGKNNYALVVHGKHKHEETRATFSQSSNHSKVVVVLNPKEAQILAECMLGDRPKKDFERYFGHKCTPGFDPQKDLQRFGVINQTTMLATETQEVMDILKKATLQLFSASDIQQHFADTSDTLCYATNENQTATIKLSKTDAHLAFVVGGYNSSNTMHLVEILEHAFPTYHIRDAEEIIDEGQVRHFNQWEKKILETTNWLDRSRKPLKIALTSGASCPDSLVDEVMMHLLEFFPGHHNIEKILAPFEDTNFV